MRRLTKDELTQCGNKIPLVVLSRACGRTMASRIVSELIEYKDIEEKLGIDLATLFKVITDGCYYRSFNEIFHFEPDVNHFASLNIENKSVDLMYADEYSMYTQANLILNGYGTQWALTREELE